MTTPAGGTVSFSYDDTPPSVNDPKSGYRGHWSQGASSKSRWEGIFAMLLLSMKVPKDLARVTATATLRFPRRGRRDEGNFRFVLEKALGDALVKGGWLTDDDASRFTFPQLQFEDETGPKRTTITLELEGSTTQEG